MLFVTTYGYLTIGFCRRGLIEPRFLSMVEYFWANSSITLRQTCDCLEPTSYLVSNAKSLLAAPELITDWLRGVSWLVLGLVTYELLPLWFGYCCRLESWMWPGAPLGETAFRIFCSIFSIRTPRLACYLDEPMLIFAEAMRVSEAETKLPLRLATAVPIFLSNSN